MPELHLEVRKIITSSLKESGNMLLEHFGKIDTVSVKQNQANIVTKADLESERYIVSKIKAKFPYHNIIAEERGFSSNDSEYTWVIDPLDGTSNFAAGISWFGVMIAFLKNFKPVLSGIYLPCDNALYEASYKEGAFLNKKKISVTKENDLKKVLFTYSLDYSKDFEKTKKEAKLIQLLVRNVRNLRATNSVIDFCYTADGRSGGCINQTTKIWDVAAPSLIISESDGIVTDINGNKLDFNINKTNFEKNFTFFASNKILHEKLLKLMTSK